MNETGKTGSKRAVAVPPFELVDKFGMLRGRFNTAGEAAKAAARIWPGEDGWRVQAAGADIVWQRSNLGPVKIT